MSLSTAVSCSFVANKDEKKPILKVLQTTSPSDDNGNALLFQVVKGSLTANNKFYWSYGERPPFNFFMCYPVDRDISQIMVDGKEEE
jgi:hypothetical protein